MTEQCDRLTDSEQLLLLEQQCGVLAQQVVVLLVVLEVDRLCKANSDRLRHNLH